MKTKIFLLIGQSGIYDSRTEWVVGARYTEEAINEFKRAVEEEVDRAFAKIAANPYEFEGEFSDLLTLDTHCTIDPYPVRTQPGEESIPVYKFGEPEPAPKELYAHGASYEIQTTFIE